MLKPTCTTTPTFYRYRYRLNELPCIDFAEDGPVRINWFMHKGSMLNTLTEVLYVVVSNLGCCVLSASDLSILLRSNTLYESL
jgi:hypothetical protein